MKPKPSVDASPPDDIRDKLMAMERQRLMNDMVVLALQTDSTRTITLSLGGLNAAPKIPGRQQRLAQPVSPWKRPGKD